MQDNDGQTSTGLVKIAIGPRVWFVDDAHPGTNSGTLNNPFVGFTGTNVNGASGAGDQDAAGDVIFMRTGTHTAQIELEADEQLLGEGEGLLDRQGRQIVTAGTDPVVIQRHPRRRAGDQQHRCAASPSALPAPPATTSSGAPSPPSRSRDLVLNGGGGGVSLSTGAVNAHLRKHRPRLPVTRGIDLDTVTGTFDVTGATTLSDSTVGLRVDHQPDR